MLPEAPRAESSADRPDPAQRLEQELVTLLAEGRTDAQVAAELFISISTVRSRPEPDQGYDELPPR